MKFPKPRSKQVNPHPDETISFLDTLQRIAVHCDNKEPFSIEDTIIEENRQKAKKKYHIRGLKKTTDEIEEEVNLSSFTDKETEFCFLPVQINQQTYQFLIDTGASRSLILDSLVPANIALQPTNTRIKVAGATPKIVKGTATFNFTISSHTADLRIFHRFLALSDCNGFAGIIGQDLLQDEMSKSLVFPAREWHIEYEGKLFKVPYSTNKNPQKAMFRNTTPIHIRPKSEMIVPVQCYNISIDPTSNYFVTSNSTPMLGIEVPPAVVKLNQSHHLITSHIKIVNFNDTPIKIPTGTELASAEDSIPVSASDLEVSNETFLETHSTLSNKPLLEEIYVNSFKNCTSPDFKNCLLYTSPSPRDGLLSRMPSSA